ncbi:MAG: hypothetical protein FWD88_06935 [Treponema sp.]|nr:hypothetical protein [Treponema sp.]
MEINALIRKSSGDYATAVSIWKAVSATKTQFAEETLAMFKGKIYELVKSKLSDTSVKYDDDGYWQYLDFRIGNGCRLSINYHMRWFMIDMDPDNPRHPAPEVVDKISRAMESLTGERHDNYKHAIWNTAAAKYPDLRDTENEDVYMYELHRIYSEKPESVAEYIVSWVEKLKSV